LLLEACAVKQKPPIEPLEEEDQFSEFPKKYRQQALDYESIGDLQNSLYCWKIVASFLPYDEEADRSIKRLKGRINTQAKKHFNKGEKFFNKGAYEAARKEFLYVIALDPNHKKTLEYLKFRLNDDNYIYYKTKEGESLSDIAFSVYRDKQMKGLVAYFSGLEDGDKIAAGQKLKLPKAIKLKRKRRFSPEAASLNKAKASMNNKDYKKALALAKNYLKNHPDDKEALSIIDYSSYQLAVELFRKKDFVNAQILLKTLNPDYRNVEQLLNFIQKFQNTTK
jgi:outer membrane protein assembly factor BamD (BamD/ComL family)